MAERFTIQTIREAQGRISDAIIRTPCTYSATLSDLTGAQIYCKGEYLQRTGSFKERGARNALLLLSPEKQAKGVIAASAGNHALGLAWHGKSLNIPVTVVMPVYAPLVKVSTCKKFGARVILHGFTFDQARAHAQELCDKEGLTYLHAFENRDVIAGQGTIGLELLEQAPTMDAVVVPVGGGGLIAGIATAIRSQRPEVAVIGVEPEAAASFSAAIRSGTPSPFSVQYTLADGLAVAQAGREALGIARPLIDRVVTVPEDSIALAILRLAELERAIIEGAGAVPLAALLAGTLPKLSGKNVVLLLSGGNIDPLAHSRVIEKGLAADGRLYRFSAVISDRPGGLAHLATVLASVGANITEIVHNRTFAGPDLSTVHVLCVVETRDADHIEEVNKALSRADIQLSSRTC